MDNTALVEVVRKISEQARSLGMHKMVRSLLFMKRDHAKIYVVGNDTYIGAYMFLDSKKDGSLDSYRIVCAKRTPATVYQIDHMFLDADPELSCSVEISEEKGKAFLVNELVPYLTNAQIQSQPIPELEDYMV